ncbi:MAG TPA: DUF5069 domain-containing protein [Candidatus Dormibacteraeota bacterium]|nr:DUF5069 domain-containing protein [Candidatus Dormibacteraeota bacterium]
MDLTKEFPRSVHAKWLGIVQIGRTVDKGKALAHGNIGDYHYNCPMDQAVFGFLGIDHEALLTVIKNAKNDAAIEAYLAPFIAKKSAQELEQWNHDYVAHKPEGESLEYFINLRNQLAPDRTDVTSWADLLDLDEKRDVPRRTPVTA